MRSQCTDIERTGYGLPRVWAPYEYTGHPRVPYGDSAWHVRCIGGMVSNGGLMLIGTAPDPILPSVLPPPRSRVKTDRKTTRRTLPAMECSPVTEHDAGLLVAALEDIHKRQAALEWLRDADLFRVCLV